MQQDERRAASSPQTSQDTLPLLNSERQAQEEAQAQQGPRVPSHTAAGA